MNLWFDLKYAWRLLLKSPGHSLLCVVVIALSLGTALIAYTGTYYFALQPLGYPNSEHWYSIGIAADNKEWAQPVVDAFTYQEMLRRSPAVKSVGAYAISAAILSEGEASTRLQAVAISPHLLAAMTAKAQVGRLFNEADSQTGAAPVVILRFNTWQTYFAADPAIVGKQTRIDSRPAQIIGVMPKDFDMVGDPEILTPLNLPTLTGPFDSKVLLSAFVVAETRQTRDTTLHEMNLVVNDLNKRYSDVFKEERHAVLVPQFRWAMQWGATFFSMIGFLGLSVTLLGCMNISMVFLARLLERARELALRSALGASRVRLLRQCLLETALIVLLGLIAGYGLVSWQWHIANAAIDATSRMQGQGRPLPMVDLQFSDAAIAVAIATIIWLLSTLLPAWRVVKQDAAIALSGNGKGAVGSTTGKTVRILVALQVLIACVLLVICVNISVAIKEDANKPSGFNAAGVMTAVLPTTLTKRYAQASERARYWEELTATIKTRMPESGVAYATALPTSAPREAVSIETRHASDTEDRLQLPLNTVSIDYFELFDLKLRSGRLFDTTDVATSSQSIAVVDENIAMRFWPGKDGVDTALGKRIQLSPANNGPWLTIVGVVSHTRRQAIATEARQAGDRELGVIYRPLRQVFPDTFHLLVKLPKLGVSSVDEGRAVLRAAAFTVDPDLPLHNLQMLDQYLAATESTGVIPVFGVVTFVTIILAATGLFGLISRSVTQRTQEVGVRRALGATKRQITAVFLREGALHLSVGVVGVGLGVIATTFLGSNFPDTLNHVLPVTIGVLILLSLVIFVAFYLPTRRAVALEPGDALRYE